MGLALLQSALIESKDELDRVAPAIRTLATDTLHHQDTTALPDYFLPSVSDSRRPRVVVCYEQGQLVALDVKVGDRVLFGKWSGTEVKIDGEELLIMKESDIMGVLA